MSRLIAVALAAYYGGGGAYMLLDPRGWLSFMVGRQIEGRLPGEHFIHDIALAALASAFGFLVFALRPKHWAAALVAAAFPALHAAMHAIDMVEGHAPRLLFDLIVFSAPALAGIAVVILGRSHLERSA